MVKKSIMALGAIITVSLIVGVCIGVLMVKNPTASYTLPRPSPTTAPTINITPSPTPSTEFHFNNFNPESGMLPAIKRGTTSSINVLISLDGLWSEETKPSFSADTGSSGIQCAFSSASWFQEWLFISVPQYTPAGTYTITITASNAGTTHTGAYTITVEDP